MATNHKSTRGLKARAYSPQTLPNVFKFRGISANHHDALVIFGCVRKSNVIVVGIHGGVRIIHKGFQ